MVYRNQSKDYLLLHPTNSKDSSKKMVTVAAAKQLIYTPNLVVANLRFDGCGGGRDLLPRSGWPLMGV